MLPSKIISPFVSVGKERAAALVLDALRAKADRALKRSPRSSAPAPVVATPSAPFITGRAFGLPTPTTTTPACPITAPIRVRAPKASASAFLCARAASTAASAGAPSRPSGSSVPPPDNQGVKSETLLPSTAASAASPTGPTGSSAASPSGPSAASPSGPSAASPSGPTGSSAPSPDQQAALASAASSAASLSQALGSSEASPDKKGLGSFLETVYKIIKSLHDLSPALAITIVFLMCIAMFYHFTQNVGKLEMKMETSRAEMRSDIKDLEKKIDSAIEKLDKKMEATNDRTDRLIEAANKKTEEANARTDRLIEAANRRMERMIEASNRKTDQVMMLLLRKSVTRIEVPDNDVASHKNAAAFMEAENSVMEKVE